MIRTPHAFRHILTGSVIALALAVPAFAATPSGGPTMGEIVTQAAPQRGVAPATPPIPTGNLPTIGDLAARPAPQAPAAPSQGVFGCMPPTLPEKLPAGAKATQAEMQEAHRVFRAFVDGGQAFTACLDKAYAANKSTVTVAQYLALTRANNDMITLMEILANSFNNELRAFNAAKPKN